jgi:hypothetical protein
VRWVFALLLIACTRHPAPEHPTEHALFRDLERQVTVAAATGWGIDRLEVENMLETTLDSTCRVDPLARRALATWLDAEIDRLGGPVEVAWRERGRKLKKVDHLLVLSRVRMLLARAEAATSECPFWVDVDDDYKGRQVSEHRFQISFGGGGKGIVVTQGDQVDVSAGGAGRLLVGRMLHDGHGIYLGLEVGGSAGFPKDDLGNRANLELAADVVGLLAYRRTFTNSYVEFEGGWLGRTTERDWKAYDHGIHVGFAFGARALRQRFLFPGAALGISYERTLIDGVDLELIKIGARVALDFDL